MPTDDDEKDIENAELAVDEKVQIKGESALPIEKETNEGVHTEDDANAINDVGDVY